MKRCEQVMGWPEAAGKAEWEKYKKDTTIERDSKGLDGCLRLWLPHLKEKHKDHEIARINRVEEGSNQDRRLSTDDREALLDFAKANVGADKDGWFQRNEPDEGQDADPAFTAPKKRPAPESCKSAGSEVEMPAMKKARVRLEKMTGPAFTAFKNTWSGKIREKVKAMIKALDNTLNKIEEGQEKINKQPEKDEVLVWYEKVLVACADLVSAWKAESAIPFSELSDSFRRIRSAN